MLRPRFIQRSCVEGDHIDLRQAAAIKRFRPDIVLFELPSNQAVPTNQAEIDQIIAHLEIAAKKYPYARSDIAVWQNIGQLWRAGCHLQAFNIDGPDGLRRVVNTEFTEKYPAVRRDWLFWAYLYTRERQMADNIERIINNCDKPNPTVAVFLQSIHWKHVRFLMRHPQPPQIWRYYFGRFPEITPENIDDKIRQRSPTLGRFWKRRLG